MGVKGSGEEPAESGRVEIQKALQGHCPNTHSQGESIEMGKKGDPKRIGQMAECSDYR